MAKGTHAKLQVTRWRHVHGLSMRGHGLQPFWGYCCARPAPEHKKQFHWWPNFPLQICPRAQFPVWGLYWLVLACTRTSGQARALDKGLGGCLSCVTLNAGGLLPLWVCCCCARSCLCTGLQRDILRARACRLQALPGFEGEGRHNNGGAGGVPLSVACFQKPAPGPNTSLQPVIMLQYAPWGRPAAALDPNTPTPHPTSKGPKCSEGPAHIWKIWRNFTGYGGVIFRFDPMCMCVYSKYSEFHGESKYVCKTRRNFLTSPIQPPTLAAGTGPPQGVIFFSKTSPICVQNDQCDEGIILRYACWDTQPPPPPRAPHFRVP